MTDTECRAAIVWSLSQKRHLVAVSPIVRQAANTGIAWFRTATDKGDGAIIHICCPEPGVRTWGYLGLGGLAIQVLQLSEQAGTVRTIASAQPDLSAHGSDHGA